MIRPVKFEDLEVCEILSGQQEIINFRGDYVSKEWLSELMIDELSYVIEIDNKVIGCAFGEKLKSNGYLLWVIGIDPDYKNLGYGTKLLEELERGCRLNNIKWVVLYSTTRSDRNYHFYKKNGYKNCSGSFWEFGKDL